MSSHLKYKSDSNLQAVDSLIVKFRFASSIHCSYYSCVQLMLHILRSDFGKSDDEVRKASFEGSKINDGLHNWLRATIVTEFEKRNTAVRSNLNDQIGQLKRLRGKADYENVEISPDNANVGRKLAKNILELLNKNFKI